MNNTQALATRQDLGVVVSSSQNRLDAIEKVGTWLAKSGMFGCDNESAGKVVAMTCLETGMGIVEFNRTYDIIRGHLHKKAPAALAEFKRKGGKFRWLKSGDEYPVKPTTAASLQLDYEGETLVYSYSMADAEREQLIKPDSRWTKRPGNMLRARCITNGLGMLVPEIFAGELDGDYDEPAPAALNLTPEAKPTATVNVSPSVTVEAEVVPVSRVSPPEDAKAEAAAGLAPVEPEADAVTGAPAVAQPANTQQQPAGEGNASPAPARPQLPPGLSAKLMDALKTHGIDWGMAMSWCRENPAGRPWIPADGTLEDLSEGNARYILTKLPMPFGRIVAEWAAKRGAQ